jgi:hypothetical protein
MDRRFGTHLTGHELHLFDSGRALVIGAVGGTLAILLYKTCELLVRGFMGGSFQFTPSEQIATVILLAVAGGLIFLVPSGREEAEKLRAENDERIQKLIEDLERIGRERT